MAFIKLISRAKGEKKDYFSGMHSLQIKAMIFKTSVDCSRTIELIFQAEW